MIFLLFADPWIFIFRFSMFSDIGWDFCVEIVIILYIYWICLEYNDFYGD